MPHDFVQIRITTAFRWEDLVQRSLCSCSERFMSCSGNSGQIDISIRFLFNISTIINAFAVFKGLGTYRSTKRGLLWDPYHERRQRNLFSCKKCSVGQLSCRNFDEKWSILATAWCYQWFIITWWCTVAMQFRSDMLHTMKSTSSAMPATCQLTTSDQIITVPLLDMQLHGIRTPGCADDWAHSCHVLWWKYEAALFALIRNLVPFRLHLILRYGLWMHCWSRRSLPGMLIGKYVEVIKCYVTPIVSMHHFFTCSLVAKGFYRNLLFAWCQRSQTLRGLVLSQNESIRWAIEGFDCSNYGRRTAPRGAVVVMS